MALEDDIKNSAQKLAGIGKETVGKVTGNDKLVAEGKKDQAASAVKSTASDVKDKLTAGE